MSVKRYIMEWVSDNPGRALGATLGLVLGLLVVFLSIIKTLIVLLFILLGFIVGKMADDGIISSGSFKNPFRRK